MLSLVTRCKNLLLFRSQQGKASHVRKVCFENKKYVAHDDGNECNVGDTVKIMETRPISKSKCWRLVKILERAK